MVINGFITDKALKEKDYEVFMTPGEIGFFYSSDVRNGFEVRTYIKDLPSFEQVFDYFLSCKKTILKRNMMQDVCLSLFFHPYFSEFYEKIKANYKALSNDRKKTIKKYLLSDLSNEEHYIGIMNYDVGGPMLKQWYCDKDVFKKSKELVEILKI